MDDRKLRSQLRNVSALELQVLVRSKHCRQILPITYLSLRPQCQPRQYVAKHFQQDTVSIHASQSAVHQCQTGVTG